MPSFRLGYPLPQRVDRLACLEELPLRAHETVVGRPLVRFEFRDRLARFGPFRLEPVPLLLGLPPLRLHHVAALTQARALLVAAFTLQLGLEQRLLGGMLLGLQCLELGFRSGHDGDEPGDFVVEMLYRGPLCGHPALQLLELAPRAEDAVCSRASSATDDTRSAKDRAVWGHHNIGRCPRRSLGFLGRRGEPDPRQHASNRLRGRTIDSHERPEGSQRRPGRLLSLTAQLVDDQEAASAGLAIASEVHAGASIGP